MAGRIDSSGPARAQLSAAPLGRQGLAQLAADVKRLVSKLPPEAQQVQKQLEGELLKALGIGPRASAVSTTDSFESGPRRPQF